ncbi:MAG TPA: tripartite tricarboxylate transporter permease [Candidatus Binatia bacterium]
MFDSFLESTGILFLGSSLFGPVSIPNIAIPIIGTLIGMFFGILPGVSGVTGMALLIPFTFSWTLIPTILLFGSIYGGGTYCGSITAILINIPGTAPNAATCLDGYPMARMGEAKTALGASAAASAMGAAFGVFVLIAMLPVMRATVLAFGPAEFFMLAVLGLTVIAVVSEGNLIKGMAAGGVGLLLAFIGRDPVTGALRFTFGALYLQDGIRLVPLFLGMFAVTEMINLAASRRKTISGREHVEELTGSLWEGVLSVFRYFGLFIRSSILGTVIGMIPGIGGTVASFVAYGHAVQSTKDNQRFGKGDIRGVIAPEACNDAKDGGSLVPVLAFGIPGSEGAALVLVAMLLHGLIPGRELMTTNLHLAFLLIWALFLSNQLTSIIGVMIINQVVRFTVIRTQLLVPFIFILAVVGAYAERTAMGDVLLTFVFGVLGYLMKKHAYPRVSLVIALILGELFEVNFRQAMRLHEFGRLDFFDRPIFLGLVLFTLLSVVYPFYQSLRARKGIGVKQSPAGKM